MEKKQTPSIYFWISPLYVCVIYEFVGVGVWELLLFCFFTCFECNCSFGFPCPLCSFVNLGRVLSGWCLGVFLGLLVDLFLVSDQFQEHTYEGGLAITPSGILGSRLSLVPFGSVGWPPPRFVSGAKIFLIFLHGCRFCAVSVFFLGNTCLLLFFNCYYVSLWEVLPVPAKRKDDQEHCQSRQQAKGTEKLSWRVWVGVRINREVMASNSSAAFFGIRDGDHQDQIKPLISPQQQLAAALPGVADAATSAPGHGAPSAAPPPPKKKRTLPGKSLSSSAPACTHLLRDLVSIDWSFMVWSRAIGASSFLSQALGFSLAISSYFALWLYLCFISMALDL